MNEQILKLPFYQYQRAVSQNSCVFACQLVRATWELSRKSNLLWEEPLVNSNDQGEIVLEWWKGEHELTIKVKENGASYLKSWGTDIFTEMEDGHFERKGFDSPLTLLWLWLHS